MIKAGIVGGTGYTAGELIRLLVNHPMVEISFVYSHSKAGAPIHTVHEDLVHLPEWIFTDTLSSDIDVLFLCLGHGNSINFLTNNKIKESTKIIDLSNDFRLISNKYFQERTFVYGLPELNRERIRDADAIANPGCFATAIQLGLLPLAHAGMLQSGIHIQGITGSTGAGSGLSDTAHFSWRNNNISLYKAFTHQHLDEISESLISLQKDWRSELNFLPMRGNFTRGIFVSLYTETDWSEEKLVELYQSYYRDAVFTQVTHGTVHLKQVVNTNQALLQVQKIHNKLLVTSVIDNLLKGASGQAVQNMNLMFDLEENTGLNLKASYF